MRSRAHHVDSLVHEFRLLRNRVEAEIQAPALLMVTSATEGDGTGFAAYGLAESLSKTHQRTVLVTSDPTLAGPAQTNAHAHTQGRRASDRLAGTTRTHGGAFSVVCLSAERIATISRSRVAEMVDELRANNDYVVIDAGHLTQNGLGLLLVGSTDAAIVAFRSGRAQHDGDRFLLDTLERAELKMIGVVMTDQAIIDHFNDRDAPAEPEAASTPKQVAMLKRFEIAAKRVELAVSRLVKSN
jgi:Mrp family chromosome partitioning ATPase